MLSLIESTAQQEIRTRNIRDSKTRRLTQDCLLIYFNENEPRLAISLWHRHTKTHAGADESEVKPVSVAIIPFAVTEVPPPVDGDASLVGIADDDFYPDLPPAIDQDGPALFVWMSNIPCTFPAFVRCGQGIERLTVPPGGVSSGRSICDGCQGSRFDGPDPVRIVCCGPRNASVFFILMFLRTFLRVSNRIIGIISCTNEA